MIIVRLNVEIVQYGKLQFASRIATNWSFDGLKIGQAIQTLTTILSAASENLNPL